MIPPPLSNIRGATSAPTEEVNVSPEMIDAGLDAMIGYDSGWEPLSDRLV
jgi:hypothetical protein